MTGTTTESERNPAEVQASREGAIGATPSPYPPTTSPQHATSTGDVHAAALKSLGDRGITNPEQFAHLDAESVAGTVRWFDAQRGRVGTGVLVAELRAGGRPGFRDGRQSLRDEYGEGVWAWLRESFPDLCDEEGRPHPAAFSAVWRLHAQLGKGSVTVVEHGAFIRGCVEGWEQQFGDDPTEGVQG